MPPSRRDDPLSAAHASDMSSLLDGRATMWIHGHTHRPTLVVELSLVGTMEVHSRARCRPVVNNLTALAAGVVRRRGQPGDPARERRPASLREALYGDRLAEVA